MDSRVLSIAGYLRSATTIVGEILGSASNALFIGEAAGFWIAWADDGLCSCEGAVRDCPFWGGVGQLLGFERKQAPQARAIHESLLAELAISWARLLRTGLSTPARISREAIDHVAALAHAMSAAADWRVVVETSKTPILLPALQQLPTVESQCLHLVRELVGVVASETHHQHSDPNLTTAPPQRVFASSVIRWAVQNYYITRIADRAGHEYLLRRYSELVAYHERDWKRLTAELRLGAPPSWEQGKVRLGQNHVVAGNPNRFAGRARTISSDDRWRTDLKPNQIRILNSCDSALSALW